ncbi:Uncharacterised protein [Klebsiella pneumoniae]|nr:Uncharacterised protein [Klebsiella pneumoniae]
MAHKTKAAMPGRQCNNTKHIQDTRLVAGGQSLGAPEITRTAPLARLGGMSVVGPTPFGYTNFSAHLQTTQALGCTALAHTPDKLRSFDRYLNSGYRCNDRCNVQHWRKCHPFGSDFKLNEALALSFEFGSWVTFMSPDTSPLSPQYANSPKINTKITIHLFGIVHLLFWPYGFCSIPRCCSSLRMMRLIQAANDSSPSCCWACSISSRNSGSSLNWNGGLPRLSFLCVDTSITPDVMCLCVMTHYIQAIKKATPWTVRAVPRRLTTNRYTR